jgi:hypothetical protein
LEAGKPKNITIRGYPNRLGLEEFEDTKGEIKVRISKMNRQHVMAKSKSTKGQTTIHKAYIYN